MIVLDEHLKARSLADAIGQWYRGSLLSINELRPGTTIKDDGILELLRAADDPMFVTINVHDFWRRIDGDPHFCVICLDLPTDQVKTVPAKLRRLLKLKPFGTLRARLGKIILMRPQSILWYSDRRQPAERLDWE